MKIAKTNYRPPNSSMRDGRKDEGLRFNKAVKLLDLSRNTNVSPKSFALIGFAVDIGVKRNQGIPGAAEGLCITFILSVPPQTLYTLAKPIILKKELRSIKIERVGVQNIFGISHRLIWFILKSLTQRQRP